MKAPPSVGVAGTVLAHGLLVAALLMVAQHAKGSPTVSYAITMTAAPAPSTATAPVVTAPPAKTPEKTVSSRAKAAKAPPKKVTPKTPTPAEARAAAKAAAPKTTVPVPGETPSTGQDVLTRTFPGLNFPYPEYLSNIINQIYSRFAQQGWPPALEATVGFTIHRDGSVTDVLMLKQSASYSFNLAARSAVIAAGNAKAFGHLPDQWPDDKLEISFSFTPRKQ